jgi:hypothetical protein
MSFRMIVPSAVSSGYPFRRRTGHIRYTDSKILCSPVPSAYPLDADHRTLGGRWSALRRRADGPHPTQEDAGPS